ncbi:MAG: RNA polymerase sigma factor [Adhaeribacter sp.]
MFFRRSHKKLPFTDEELIRQYQLTGDSAYIGDLYQRYMHLAYGWCLKYFKDEEDSKDAVMQVFEKLLQVLKTQEISKFQFWLHVLVRNHCLMALRKRKSHDTTPLEPLAEVNPGILNIPQDESQPLEDQLRQLEEGLDHLPEAQKTCIDLFYLQKKCYQEIADSTGYDLNKVKSAIQNGKRNLKIYLEKHHDRS